MSYTRPVGVRELRQKVGVGTAVNVSRRTCLPVEIIVVVDRPVDAYLILGFQAEDRSSWNAAVSSMPFYSRSVAGTGGGACPRSPAFTKPPTSFANGWIS